MAGIRKKPQHRQSWISQILFGLSVMCLLSGLVCLAWAVWPYSTDGVQIDIPAGVLPVAPEGTGYASLADYNLGVSWPRWLRLGDKGSIDVFLTGDVEAVDSSGNQMNQIVLVDITLSRLRVSPAGLVQYNLTPGADLEISRVVDADQKGEFPGKVLVSFGFYDEAKDELLPVPVAVMDILINVRSLWGLERGIVLWLGFVGLVLWGVLFLLGRYLQIK